MGIFQNCNIKRVCVIQSYWNMTGLCHHTGVSYQQCNLVFNGAERQSHHSCVLLVCRGIGHLAHLPGLTHVRMAGCPRIKLYQESRETSGKLDIHQWAEYAQTPNERNNRARSWKRLLCICSAPEAE